MRRLGPAIVIPAYTALAAIGLLIGALLPDETADSASDVKPSVAAEPSRSPSHDTVKTEPSKADGRHEAVRRGAPAAVDVEETSSDKGSTVRHRKENTSSADDSKERQDDEQPAPEETAAPSPEASADPEPDPEPEQSAVVPVESTIAPDPQCPPGGCG